MRKRVSIAGVALILFASGLLAQGGGLTASPCPAGGIVAGIPDQTRIAQDVCTQAFDVFQFMAPQLGLALAGGNATIGQGGTLGGLGHASVGVRANFFSGLLPDVAQFPHSNTGAVQRELPTKNQFLGLPTADGAVGIFKGIPVGLTNVGGIDLLGSLSYVPTINGSGNNEVSVTPVGNWQFGYGARIGLLQESIVSPGVSVTYLKRNLPKTTIVGTTSVAGTSGVDSLSVLNASVKTSAWRVVASKNLIAFSIAGGVGQDKYEQSADIEGVTHTTVLGIPVTGRASVPASVTEQTLTRTNFFFDLSANLPLFKLVGEVGSATGGTVNTYNSFSGGRADRSQVYWSVGIRFAF
jgi:hypothetical protein